jgi:hypothetical protein
MIITPAPLLIVQLNYQTWEKSWTRDLTKAASRLPFHCPAWILTHQTSVKDVEDYQKLVQKFMLEWLQGEN